MLREVCSRRSRKDRLLSLRPLRAVDAPLGEGTRRIPWAEAESGGSRAAASRFGSVSEWSLVRKLHAHSGS